MLFTQLFIDKMVCVVMGELKVFHFSSFIRANKANHKALSVICGSQTPIEGLSEVRCTLGMQRTFAGAHSGCKGPAGSAYFRKL